MVKFLIRKLENAIVKKIQIELKTTHVLAAHRNQHMLSVWDVSVSLIIIW